MKTKNIFRTLLLAVIMLTGVSNAKAGEANLWTGPSDEDIEIAPELFNGIAEGDQLDIELTITDSSRFWFTLEFGNYYPITDLISDWEGEIYGTHTVWGKHGDFSGGHLICTFTATGAKVAPENGLIIKKDRGGVTLKSIKLITSGNIVTTYGSQSNGTWTFNFEQMYETMNANTTLTITKVDKQIDGKDAGTASWDEGKKQINSKLLLEVYDKWQLASSNSLGKGLYHNNTSKRLALQDCKKGEVITLNMSAGSTPDDGNLFGLTNLTQSSANGNTYVFTVKADGDVCFKFRGSGNYIHSITVAPAPAAQKHNVIFWKNDGTQNKQREYQLEEGANIVYPDDPQYQYHDFKGWKLSDGSAVPQTMPDYDLNIYAQWEVSKYRLRYVVDNNYDNPYASYQVPYGARLADYKPADPTKAGYTFTGWSNWQETMPGNNIDLTAIFTESQTGPGFDILSNAIETVGNTELTTAYLGDTSNPITIASGGSLNYVFRNNSDKAQNWDNWILLVANNSQSLNGTSASVILRNDNWDVATNSNNGCSSNFNWDTFKEDMDGSDVNMTIAYENGALSVTSTITKQGQSFSYTYSFTKNLSGAPSSIAVCLSVEKAYLQITREQYTAPDLGGVPAPIGATGYATFSRPEALDFSSVTGLKAYYASEADDEVVTLKRVTGTVAANTGLVLIGTPNSTLQIPIAASGTRISGNMLVSVTQSGGEYVNESFFYVLAYNETDGLRFASTANKEAHVPQYHAFLDARNVYGSRQLMVRFEDEGTTAIQTLPATNDSAPVYYNLNGQRVDQPQRGTIYIVNGRKVMMK